MQLKLRAHHDNRAAGVVHALAQQVLAEAALLAPQQVGQGFEGAVSRACHGAAAAAVVNQGVHSLLQHALLVAHDDIGRTHLQHALEAVVAVDDAAIQVVQVAGGEAAAVQLHHGAQVRGNDGQHIQNHPLRAVVAGAECLNHFQALDGVGSLLALGLLVLFLFDQDGDFGLQISAELIQIQLL